MIAVPLCLLASAVLSTGHPILDFLPNFIRPKSSSPSSIFGSERAVIVTPLENALSSVLGPLTQHNFPDPGIFVHEGKTYAFATNNKGLSEYGMIHIQVSTSEDNKTWTMKDGWDALPTVGAWETGHRVWAPDVVQVADGTFVMYYSDDTVFAPDKHCVGVATSQTILGPYTPRDEPFVCPDVYTEGGAIDPDGYLDPSDGRRYVTYKVDGNSVGHGGLCNNMKSPQKPTPIMLQEVNAQNGIDHIGDPLQILDRDALDGPLIEAPSLIRSDEGIYFLFYSPNCFTTPGYATSYATASDIRGPYTKAHRPLIYTGAGGEQFNLIGPGGFDIWLDGKIGLFHGHLTKANKLGDLGYLKGHQQHARSPRHKNTPSKPNNHDPPPVSRLVRTFYGAWGIWFSGTEVFLNGTDFLH